MWIALALNAVLYAGLLAVAGWLFTVKDGWSVVVLFLGLALAGAVTGSVRRGRRTRREAERGDDIERQVTRLCLIADVPEPAVELVLEDAPLSWTPRSRAGSRACTSRPAWRGCSATPSWRR